MPGLFEVLRRRHVARILRPGDELLRVVGPELAHAGIGGDGGVDELAALALDLADVDVEDGLAVLAEAYRPHRSVVELHFMQRSDERGLVLEPALDALHRLLHPQARGVSAGRVAPRRPPASSF